jgi:hypothetical protein
VTNGPARLVSRLLETGADVDAGPGMHGIAISAARFRSDVQLLKLLLASSPTFTLNMPCGYSPHVKDHGTPLYIAAMRGNHEAVDLLLAAGADPNSHGTIFGDALQMAAASGYDEIVEKLLQHGADPTLIHGSFGTAYSATWDRSEGKHLHARDEERKSIAKSLRPLSRPPTDQGFLWKEAMAAAAFLTNASGSWWSRIFETDQWASFYYNAGKGLTNSQKDAIKAYYYTVPSEQLRDAIQSGLRQVDGYGLWEEIRKAFDLGQSPVWGERSFTTEYNTVYSYRKHYFRASINFISTSVSIVITL